MIRPFKAALLFQLFIKFFLYLNLIPLTPLRDILKNQFLHLLFLAVALGKGQLSECKITHCLPLSLSLSIVSVYMGLSCTVSCSCSTK